MTMKRALNLLLVAAPLLGVCHGEYSKKGSPAFVPRSRGADREPFTGRQGLSNDGFDDEDYKSSPLDEFDDIINSFDENCPDDDVFDIDEMDSDRQDDYEEYSRDANDDFSREDGRKDELQTSTGGSKGSLYDAYNQLHTLAQVRRIRPRISLQSPLTP